MRSDSLAPGLVTALTACAVVAGSLASAQSGISERLLEVLRLRGESAYRLPSGTQSNSPPSTPISTLSIEPLSISSCCWTM